MHCIDEKTIHCREKKRRERDKGKENKGPVNEHPGLS